MKRTVILKILAVLLLIGVPVVAAGLLLRGVQSKSEPSLVRIEHASESNPASPLEHLPEPERIDIPDSAAQISESIAESEENHPSISETILPLPKLPVLAAPKQHADDILRIGFLTDPHIWSEEVGNTTSQKKIGPVYIQKINHFLRQMNDVFGPDFIVINGDVIEGTKVPSDQGKEELRQTKTLFGQTTIPKYWVIGNHDVRSLTKAEWKEVLGIDYLHKSFTLKGHRIITVDSNFGPNGEDARPGNSKRYTRGFVADEELEWLKGELLSPEPKIVFLHHPPTRSKPGKPDSGILRNADELRALFVGKNVKAVFGGHIEELQAETQDGTDYFVFPGMTKSPAYAGNFVSISIGQDRIKTQMSYIGKDGNYLMKEIRAVPTERD